MQDLQEYKIYKQSILDADGNITIVDNREVEACKQFQISFIREMAEKKILEVAPIYKQLNALSGSLLAEEAEQIIAARDAIRSISNSMQEQVNSIIWDGTEETRIAVCDEIEKIRWS